MIRNHEKAPSVEETEFGGTSVSQQRRVIHFANGDTLEQDSSDGEGDAPRKEPFSAPDNTAQISWREYSWCLWTKAGKKSLQTCDFIGEKLANLVGLNMAKYQYAIDEFHRDKMESQGLMHGGTEGAPCVDKGAETIQLSPGKSAETIEPQAHRTRDTRKINNKQLCSGAADAGGDEHTLASGRLKSHLGRA
ncbi:hypothetical protein SKAU_G00182530 [Synaphobranchus kaupii]|uniref:Uncharacterized protein n=1 Tax=Synaphobranchus kaupii TaxID=118154 RepID=A0A9Q1FC51_SYNKA|nr:hypothetical protein SKAU_G00182530 [Synaphobranchus kaupii]